MIGFSKIVLMVIASMIMLKVDAFVSTTAPSIFGITSTTSLNACRVNAKKEKRKRNRDNMRKFMKKGGSKRKQLRKIQGNNVRQQENEFIAKCFTLIPAVEEDSKK